MSEETTIIHKQVNDASDSLTIGSAAKGGIIKIYGDFNKDVEFKAKIDKAKEVRTYAQTNLAVNI